MGKKIKMRRERWNMERANNLKNIKKGRKKSKINGENKNQKARMKVWNEKIMWEREHEESKCLQNKRGLGKNKKKSDVRNMC